MSCPFCNKKNIMNKLPDGTDCIRWIYEDDTSFAVLTIEPCTHGHTLVIFKDHKSDITDQVDEGDFNKFSNAIRKVSESLKKNAKNHCGKNPEKIYVGILSDGIEHLHAHVIPRYPFTERDKANYRETFIPRDGVYEVNKNIEKGKLGGFWYIALREREWKNSEFAKKSINKQAQILQDLAKELKID